jgi:tripartite ATP-independent transporter DctM subunit
LVVAHIKEHERGEETFSFSALLSALRGAILALSVPAILVVGIFGGWFSSVEAGSITSVVALVLGTLIYRDMDLRSIFDALKRSVHLSALIFVIIAAAGPFTWLLTRLGALDLLEAWLLSFAGNRVAFTLALLALIFVAGMFLDASANVIVLGPLLVPICVEAGFAPVQAALVVVIGFLLGTVTPPVGVCYFTAAAIACSKLEQTAIALLPFLAVEVLVLLLILLVGPLTLALPAALGFL